MNLKATFSFHAKTFYFAALFFPRQVFADVSKLYYLLRTLDDAIDLSSPADGQKYLMTIRQELQGALPLSSALEQWRTLQLKYDLKDSWLDDFFLGLDSDLAGATVHTVQDLETYCYRVAGVVGLMMCPLIGVRETKAHAAAIHLGIAMQMTNILRDVAEDLERGRVYLPSTLLERRQISRQQLLNGGVPLIQLQSIMAQVYDQAEHHYEQAKTGYSAIPFRTRMSIVLAAEMYRNIGHRLRAIDFDPTYGRMYVPRFQKIWIALKSVPQLFSARTLVR